MKSPKILMTIEEFDLMEQKFGWKHEYWDGHAHISPRSHGILMKIPVKKRRIKTDFEIQSVSEDFFDELVETFYKAFVDSPEYCNRSRKDVKKSARKNIRLFFDGGRGVPQLALSRVVFAPPQKTKIAGAILVCKYKYGFKDEILFVHPEFQRKGIGTALVQSVLNDLSKSGERIFWSEYHICNRLSAAWHEKFGFVEEPDIMTAKFRWRYFQQEVYRHEQLGNFKKAEKFKPLLEKAEAEVERLTEIEKEDFGAAWLNWKYDY